MSEDVPANDRALDDRRSTSSEEAWANEIERRMADYRAGKIKTLSWQDVRAHLHRADR